MNTPRYTRRDFLHVSATAAATAALSLRSRTASALSRKNAANERIVTGHIGVGGQGRHHFNSLLRHPRVQIAAAADVDSTKLDDAKQRAARDGVDIDNYSDFREMLERSDIDAIFIATPDHWHAINAIQAMEAGKDVYCEKPLTLTIAESKAMVETARRLGRVCQMGTQQRSDWWFRHACELVRNGRIGYVNRCVCFIGENPRNDWLPNEAPPEHLDWDMWLGPAPSREYHGAIHPGAFRFYRDYSGGTLTDWGVHLFDIAQWGLGKDDTSPRKIEAHGEMYDVNMFEYPRTIHIQYDYADTIVEWSQDNSASFEQGQGYGTKFYGSEADLFVNRGGYWIHPKKDKKINEQFGPNDIRLYDSPGHWDDFFDCMYSRKRPICDVEIGHRATAISHLGNIAYRLSRPVYYHPEKEEFLDDEGANKMLSKPMRAPWRL